jgi:Fe2+ or Zn2+ uptake regulation protein
MVPNIGNSDRPVIRRKTTQRESVLKAICDGEHPTAREIFETVSSSQKMSFGTVYRNLQILVEEGEIICVQTDKAAVHYDRRIDRHHHFHCRKCGKVFNSPFPYSANIDKEAAEKSNFVIEFHSITFEGLCPDCAGRH